MLKKTYTLELRGLSVKSAFDKIEKQTGVYLTYNPRQISQIKIVQNNFDSRSLEYILKAILGKETELRVVGRNVIIRIPAKKPDSTPKRTKITGSITNAKTGAKIKNVTVFQLDKKDVVLSDSNSYELEVVNDEEYVELVFNKKDFKDTIVIIKASEVACANIELQPLSVADTMLKDTLVVEDVRIVQKVSNEEQLIHAENSPDYTHNSLAQTSLLPFVSTNRKMNVNSVNNASFNVFGGYSKGVKGVEVGGLFNINRDQMTGTQVAGVSNVVGGEIEGVQVAGFSNVSLDTLKGIQASGFVNVSKGDVQGVQFSGFVNSSFNNVFGIQATGFVNSALKDVQGIQACGFVNAAIRNFTGIQASGFVNFVRHDCEGVQLSGVNFSRDNKGIQLGYLINYARDVDGIQTSTFFNRARDVKGLQLGIFNVANSVKGASIGILSFVNKGYQSVEVSTGDTYLAELSVKTGTNSFYNILSAGIISTTEDNINSLGYGIGARIPFAKKQWSFDFDAKMNGLIHSNTFSIEERISLLYNSNVFLSHMMTKHIILRAGITWNKYERFSDSFLYQNDVDISLIKPKTKDNGDIRTDRWMGYKLALGWVF